MGQLEAMDDKAYIFGSVFVVANKLNTLLDRELAVFGMTATQWFLSVSVQMLFDEAPTLKQVAMAMGSSHQNVKQVALKLVQKGLLTMEKDPRDRRATILKLTDKSLGFWGQTQQKGDRFREAVFQDISPDDLKGARAVLQKVWSNLNALEDIK